LILTANVCTVKRAHKPRAHAGRTAAASCGIDAMAANATSHERGDKTPVEIAASLRVAGLIPADVEPRFVALTGGVASDIWKVEAGDTLFVVKRALPKLRVAAEWLAPVSRNASEAEWYRVAASIVPGVVPDILFHDPEAGLFVMSYFPPERCPVWKS